MIAHPTKGRRLEDLIGAIRPCRVAVIGDVMLDRYVRGRVERVSPEAPIQILTADPDADDQLPGGAANVAFKAADLGAEVGLVGLIGSDEPGEALRSLLRDRPGLVDALVEEPGRATTLKTRFLGQNQQLLRVDRERRDRPSAETIARLAEAARRASATAEAVVLEDYGKGTLAPEVIAAALAGAAESKAPVIVDPNGRDYRRYAGATVLTPNLREAEIAAERPIGDDRDLEAAAASLVQQTRGAALAITKDSRGISLFRLDPAARGLVRHLQVPTVPVAVFDVTGAGDAVAASLAVGLACGLDLPEACALANLAGRTVVRQPGVGAISTAHLRDEAAELGGRATKLLDFEQARRRADQVRHGGGKVVFTNGCFDILHSGHAALLQYARAQGDFLVLGLNTDASIRRLKGPDRPIVDEAQRAFMLALYPFVDAVVLFDDDTPMDLIEALRPDVLVKGGDYSPDAVVGRTLVESYGGQVAIFARIDGQSTTDLVRKIQARSYGKAS